MLCTVDKMSYLLGLVEVKTPLKGLMGGSDLDDRIVDMYLEAVKRDLTDIDIKEMMDQWHSNSVKWEIANRVINSIERDFKEEWNRYFHKLNLGEKLSDVQEHKKNIQEFMGHIKERTLPY